MTRQTITIEHTVSMGHRLPSYKGLCSSPHGHNMRVVVTLETEGFVDFKQVSEVLGAILMPFDHAMILQESDPLLKVLNDMGFRTFPTREEPTTEALAQLIMEIFSAVLGDRQNVGSLAERCEVIQVTVHETAKYSATATITG